MTPEEYQRLKEAEKEHLRSLRKLKQTVRSLQRQKKLTDAVENVTTKPMDALSDHDALVRELAMETARNEARLDVALESVSADSAKEAALDAEAEETLRKAKAAELVRQLRSQVDGVTPGSTAAAVESPEKKEAGAHDQLPEKTIGRMKR